MTALPDLIPIETVAQTLHLPGPRQVKRLVIAHGTHYRKIGRAWLFTPGDVAELVEALRCSQSDKNAPAAHGTSGAPSASARKAKSSKNTLRARLMQARRENTGTVSKKRSASSSSTVLPFARKP